MTVIDRALLNHGFPGSTWGNLGLWTHAQDYPAACEALAIRLAERAQLKPGCSVLDVGFGYGDQLQVWKERFHVGRITGIETDAAGIAEARNKMAAFADVALHLGNSLSATEERYDRVLALDCAYHFAPRSEFFRHAARALHPGGVLALTDMVLADGESPDRHARFAKACDIPAENLLTQPSYGQALEALGFRDVQFQNLDQEVLSGFSRFAMRLLRRHAARALGTGGLKILATAAMAAWLLRSRRVHYVLVSAERSSAATVAR